MRYAVCMVLCCALSAAAAGAVYANGSPHPGGYIVAVYPALDDLGCPNDSYDNRWSAPWGDMGNEYFFHNGWQRWPQPGDGTYQYPFQRWHAGSGSRNGEHFGLLTDIDGAGSSTAGIWTHGKAVNGTTIHIDPMDCPQCNPGDGSGGYPAMEWYFTYAYPANQLANADYYQAKLFAKFCPQGNAAYVRVSYEDLSDFQHDGADTDPTNTAEWHLVGGEVCITSQQYQYYYSDPVAMTWPAEYADRVLFVKGWHTVPNGPHGTPEHYPSHVLLLDEVRLGGYDGP